jgi:DNA polymerase
MLNADALSPQELTALLHFYADSGVDWLLEDAPVDRIAAFAEAQAERAAKAGRRTESAAAAPPPQRDTAARTTTASDGALRPAASASVMAVPDGEAVAAARLVASSAQSLDELKAAMEGFTGCNLKSGARCTVFASGNPASGVMVIGPMPSADDDRDALPFSGRAGQLLDKMLASIGIDRAEALLSNAIPWRPPGNRTPSPAEIDICRPFIERQITLASPKALLLLGNFTAKFFFGGDGSILNLRGAWRDIQVDSLTLKALASFHPQDLLTAPANKPLAWRDLLLFRQELEHGPSPAG